MDYSSSSNDHIAMADLRELLASRIGFDSDVLGSTFLSSIVSRCQAQAGMSNVGEFVRAAAEGGEWWHLLLDTVVVSETWFFRDAPMFSELVERVRASVETFDSRATRIFSCPCATGEEPFSVAMALSAAGIAPKAFTIEAADVSPRLIRTAQQGFFSARSFREVKDRDLNPYFDPQNDHGRLRLAAPYREMVQFRILNLAAAPQLPMFDIILCRNLLIYLHDGARRSVMETLQNSLAPGGVLFVGHAEASIALECGLRPAGDPRAFGFVRPDRLQPAARPERKGLPPLVRDHVVRPIETSSGRRAVPTLQEIRNLGDRGAVAEAIRACRQYLHCSPDSVDGHFLLGVLLSAQGDKGSAESALRRALYLDPNHPAALEHLAFSEDAKGDSKSAIRLRARIRRGERERAEA